MNGNENIDSNVFGKKVKDLENDVTILNKEVSTTNEMKLDDMDENHNQNGIPKTYNLSTDNTIKKGSDSFSRKESGHEESLCQKEHKTFQHDLNDGTRTIVHGSISIRSLGLVQESDLMKKNINEINGKISNLEIKMEENTATLIELTAKVDNLDAKVDNISININAKVDRLSAFANNLFVVQEKMMTTVETLLKDLINLLMIIN